MPYVNILGINIYIPDLSDLTNAVVQPLQGFVNQQLQNIKNDIVAAFNFANQSVLQPFQGFISQQLQNIYNSLIGAINYANQNILQPIESFIINQLTNLGNSVLGGLGVISNNIIQPIQNFINQQLQNFYNSFVAALNFANNRIIQPLTNLISSQLQNLVNGINNSITSGSQYIVSNLQSFLTNYVLQPLRNVGAFMTSGFNQLATGLNQFSADITNSLNNLGKSIVQGLIDFINNDVRPIFTQAVQILNNGINFAAQTLNKLFLQSANPDPNQALNNLLTVVTEVAAVSLGTYGALAVIENLNPFSNLKLTDTFKKVLEIAGIAELPHFISSLALDSGFKLQVEYFFNYNIQPRKVDLATAQTTQYYQTRDSQYFTDALRYEGFNDNAIKDHIDTLYEPLPIRMAVKFMDSNIFLPDFYTKTLLRNGLDPTDAPNVIKALKLLNLKPFEQQIKSIIYLTYKDGYLSTDTAYNIAASFGIPSDQMKWLFYTANLEYQYQQKKALEGLILAEVKKGIYTDPNAAITDLVSLGMTNERATVLVKTAAVTSFITLKAADKNTLLQAFESVLT